MIWCTRCGRFFIASLSRYANGPVTARGPVIDIPDSVCNSCLKSNEYVDDNGMIRDGPRPERPEHHDDN